MVNVLPIEFLFSSREKRACLREALKPFTLEKKKGVSIYCTILKTHLNPHKRLERFLFLQNKLASFTKAEDLFIKK